MTNHSQQLPSITELEWAHRRTEDLWREVIAQKNIPPSLWAGMFSELMARLVQGTSEDQPEAVELSTVMLEIFVDTLNHAIRERFGDDQGEINWQQ